MNATHRRSVLAALLLTSILLGCGAEGFLGPAVRDGITGVAPTSVDATPTDGTAPADGAGPADGTGPADGSGPADGTGPADGSGPADGIPPGDGACTADTCTSPTKSVRLGANLEAIAFFTKNDAFNNLMLQAGTNGGAVWGGADERDANGWPTASSNNIRLRQGLDVSPGVYEVQFETTASGATAAITHCTMSNRVATDLGNGVWRVTYDAAYTSGDLDFSYAGSPGGIRNLKVTHPGHAADEVLNREFVARARHFAGLRFYQAQGEEGYGVNTNVDKWWSERRRPTYATWCTSNDLQNGIPYEGMIQMCNALDTDCYVNIPFLAIADTGVAGEGRGDGLASTDDYVTKVAQVFKYGSDGSNPYTSPQANPVWPPLKPGLKVYVELSNELWNGSYPYSRDKNWITAAARRLYDGGNPYGYRAASASGWQPQASRIGQMIMKVSDLWRAVFGDAAMGTTVRILSSGFTGDDFSSQVLHYIDDRKGSSTVAHYVYAFAVAPYFNQGGASVDACIAAMAADATDTDAGVDDNGGALLRDSARAAEFGIKVVAYEGGIGNLGISDDDVGRAVQLDDRVRTQVLKPYFDRWFSDGNDEIFFYYSMLKGWSVGQNGFFGLSESVADESGPKWQAVIETLEGVR